MLLKQIQKLPRCQFSSNHSIIILNLRRCPRLQQQINNFPIPQLRRIVKRSIMIMIPLIKTNPSTNQQLTILQMIRLNCYMERSLTKISKSIDIYSRMVNQTTYYLDGRVHSCVVKW